MIRVCHLLDADAGWQQRVAIAQLLDRLPADRCAALLATIDPKSGAALRPLGRVVYNVPRRAGLDVLAAPAVRRFLDAERIDLVHAWGRAAAAAARAADRPLVGELFDPLRASRDVKVLRALARPKGFAVACAAEIVRRRLIEGGLAPELALLLRPAADFARINEWKRGPLRRQLGLSANDRAVVLAEAAAHADGPMDAFLAVAMLNTVSGNLRFLVQRGGPGPERLARLANNLPIPPTLICADGHVAIEKMIAISDVLIVPVRGDASTTAIAWAMAAGVPVIGSAVYAVAEMISSGVNGLLFKQTPRKSMTVAIAKLLQDTEALAKVREVARGQAYEVFGLRRYVDQHLRLYENVLAAAPPSQGIADPARAG
jgi:hypothetical protein